MQFFDDMLMQVIEIIQSTAIDDFMIFMLSNTSFTKYNKENNLYVKLYPNI